jgi:hypothetical protein
MIPDLTRVVLWHDRLASAGLPLPGGWVSRAKIS